MSGVVDPGRCFVGNQPARPDEELDVHDAHIVEVGEHPAQVLRSTPLQCGRAKRGASDSQDPVAVDVAVQRIDPDFATGTARAENRHLAIERHELFIESWCAVEGSRGAFKVRGGAQHLLALAVVAEAPCLQHAGQSDTLNGTPQARGACDCGITRGWYAQTFEQALFGKPVLRHRERSQRRRNGTSTTQRSQRGDRDVLPVERDHVAAAGELSQCTQIGEGTLDKRAHLPSRRLRGAVQKQHVEAEWIARERKHPAELAGADDAHGHEARGLTAREDPAR